MKMLGIVFSNIYDTSMGDLTRYRTVASLPFGGRYRQIDFVLSNMVNSNITSIGVITKYNYQSLMDHLGNCSEWDLNRKNEGLFILPPFASGHTSVYRGKLEALYSAVNFLNRSDNDYVLMCDSTVICNIDFDAVLESHIKSGAQVTVVANQETITENKVNNELVLKMKDNKVYDMAINGELETGDYTGMGMYIMEKKLLLQVINHAVSHGLYHYEREYLLRQFINNDIDINVYKYDGVVLRNRNIESFFRNNLKLIDNNVRNAIFRDDAPIYTKVRDEAPTMYENGCNVNECIVADGCIIEGCIENSVIFRDVTIEEGADVQYCIIMQGAKIGKNCNLKHIIIDKDVIIRDNTTLVGAERSPLIISKDKVI